MWQSSPKNNSLSSWLIKLLILGGVLVLIFLFGETLYRDWTQVQEWVKDQGAWAPIIFIALVVLLPICFFPTDPLCFFGGALFGLAWGGFYAVTGMLISASLMYFLSQWLLRDWLRKKLPQQDKLKRVDRVVQSGGFTAMFLLRILPLPFALLSYFLGMSGVRFRDYFLAIFGTMGTVLLGVYYGSVANHMAKLGTAEHSWKASDVWHVIFWVVLFLVLALLTRLAQKKLRQLEQS